MNMLHVYVRILSPMKKGVKVSEKKHVINMSADYCWSILRETGKNIVV